MKTTKRILAIALALALGLALFAPMASAAVDPNAPIITKQPKLFTIKRAGQDIVLEVEASLPEGSDGVLSYAWYDYDWQEEGKIRPPVATGAKLQITDQDYAWTNYWLVAINTYTDDDGATQTAYTQSMGSIVIDINGTNWWNIIPYVPFLAIVLPFLAVTVVISFFTSGIVPFFLLAGGIGVFNWFFDLFR